MCQFTISFINDIAHDVLVFNGFAKNAVKNQMKMKKEFGAFIQDFCDVKELRVMQIWKRFF